MNQETESLEKIAQELRVWIIQMITHAQSGHPGGSLSIIDLLVYLFFKEMHSEDRFILSKGHAAPALYAVLAKKGMIPTEELKTFRQIGSRLQGHPDRVRLPLVEASTGSLGQGLSVAQGMAMGFRLKGRSSRVFCVIGDGESQEGQIWEAALSASKFKLSNLCVILDHNNGQIDGHVSFVMPIEPIASKWESFGWKTIEVEGHSMSSIEKGFEILKNSQSQPVLVIAHTIKGKGVSFMEDQIQWHGKAPTQEEAKQAILEIQKD